MNEQMNPEDAIERVLTGLGSVEAPTQIESRVLEAIQRRAAAQAGPMVHAPFLRARSWALAAGVVVLVLVASIAMGRRHGAQPGNVVLKQHTVPGAAAALPPAFAEVRPEHRSRAAVLSISENRKAPAKPEVLSDEDALAISEMNAPSRPAPPLPLTRQEKLLAGALHQAGPDDLSSLRPEVRQRQMELSKAEFLNFFEPPPAKAEE